MYIRLTAPPWKAEFKISKSSCTNRCDFWCVCYTGCLIPRLVLSLIPGSRIHYANNVMESMNWKWKINTDQHIPRRAELFPGTLRFLVKIFGLFHFPFLWSKSMKHYWSKFLGSELTCLVLMLLLFSFSFCSRCSLLVHFLLCHIAISF